MLIFKSLFGGSDGNAGDHGWIHGSGRSLEKVMATHSSILRILDKSMDRGSLEGYRPWGSKELDMTERLTLSLSF